MCDAPRDGSQLEAAPCPCSQPSPEDRLGEAANKCAVYRRRHDLTQRQRRLSLAGRGTVSSGTDIPLGLRNLPALLRMGDYQLTVEQRQRLSGPVMRQANLVPENPKNAANLQRKIK